MKRLMMVLMLTLLALVGCKQSNPMTELLNYKGSYLVTMLRLVILLKDCQLMSI